MKMLVSRTMIFVLALLVVVVSANAQSPREQLQQMVQQLQSNPNDNALRERIIKLAQEIKPPPAVPEEVERRIVRGTAAFKGAKSTADYHEAAREFEQAALAAPWYADAYYNLATARSKAEDYAGAVWSLRFYLLAAPDAKDVKEAKALMYEMEYKQERANKDKAEAEAIAAKKAQGQRLLESFRGTWYGRNCMLEFSGAGANRGCTDSEAQGSNWYVFRIDEGPNPLSFELRADGTIKPEYASWAGCSDLTGIPQGPSFENIRWEDRPKDGPTRQVWSDIRSDGQWLKISCNRPLTGANPNTAYRYVVWSRNP